MNFVYAVALVSGIGLICGLGLALANLFLSVKGNEKAEAVLAVLPGANCGACSFSGCKAYAEALATGKVKTTLCIVGGDKVAAQISEILGVEASAVVKKTAVVFCRGSADATEKKYLYQGITTCKAASALFGGDGACRYGCVGLGDCVSACNYGAITVQNGVAVVNPNQCVACGLCMNACPKHIIKLMPKKKTPLVLCMNTDKGAQTRKVCSAGCTGCRLCAKVCEAGAITFDNWLAVIHREKCTGCSKCEAACKVNVIVRV